MARKKKEFPILEQIEITGVAAEGKALARINDMVVFVPYVVPGDIVDLKIRRKKHNYAEAEAVKFHKRSDKRAIPFCKHYGVCGGCKWQCLKYEYQLKYKQQQVIDALTRIGKVELPEVTPILGSDKTQCYRNKLEFTFSDKRWLTREEIEKETEYENMNALGFHIPDAFDKVLDIEECILMEPINNKIRNELREFAIKEGIAFYNLRSQTGLLRNIMIRTSVTKEIMLLIQARVESEKDEKTLMKVMSFCEKTFPEVTSLLYVINNKCNDTFGDLDVKTFKGTDFIYEQMENLKFKVGPKSFYQTNSNQAYNLYKIARNFAALSGEEIVYDLYTGTGTIANFIARNCKKVIGIEYVPEAIEDAKFNAHVNGHENMQFYAGDMKEVLTREFIEQHGKPDVIITDPPRAGMHTDVIETILFASPERIVYVSCNPATQARDLALLDKNYKITAVQPVDMFPHTHHVENVVQLVRRENI